jgi:hypothetical protein
MGARTTWKIKTNDSGAITWLYSHWGGDSKFETTKNALDLAEARWGDPTYGARIFISNVVGNAWSSETGFGITSTLDTDSNPFEESYTPYTIDFVRKVVILGDVLGEDLELGFSEFTKLHTLGDLLLQGVK